MIVCGPSARPEKEAGLVQALKPAPSKLQPKDAASLAVNENVARSEFDGLTVAVFNVTTGAVKSTMKSSVNLYASVFKLYHS